MIVNVIHLISLLFSFLIVGYILSTWIFPPFHEFRRAMASLVEPFLNPIRRVIPPAGMIDFSALILLILLQVLEQILVALFR
jgi:uncharacterized protein YggT (Ycf19 family)